MIIDVTYKFTGRQCRSQERSLGGNNSLVTVDYLESGKMKKHLDLPT